MCTNKNGLHSSKRTKAPTGESSMTACNHTTKSSSQNEYSYLYIYKRILYIIYRRRYVYIIKEEYIYICIWKRHKTKSRLMGLVFSTPGAKARKSSNRPPWNWFCRLLEPTPESHQIELHGTGFVDFWSQGQKVIKSSLLRLVLSTSRAKARKSSNRASWD